MSAPLAGCAAPTAAPSLLLGRDALLTPEQVSSVLPEATAYMLAQWRRRGIGPRYVRETSKGRIWYRVADLLAWAEEHTNDPAQTVPEMGGGAENTASAASGRRVRDVVNRP